MFLKSFKDEFEQCYCLEHKSPVTFEYWFNQKLKELEYD